MIYGFRKGAVFADKACLAQSEAMSLRQMAVKWVVVECKEASADLADSAS